MICMVIIPFSSHYLLVDIVIGTIVSRIIKYKNYIINI